MSIELNRRNKQIIITLLLERCYEISDELKELSDLNELEQIRLERELEDTLDTLKKFEVR